MDATPSRDGVTVTIAPPHSDHVRVVTIRGKVAKEGKEEIQITIVYKFSTGEAVVYRSVVLVYGIADILGFIP